MRGTLFLFKTAFSILWAADIVVVVVEQVFEVEHKIPLGGGQRVLSGWPGIGDPRNTIDSSAAQECIRLRDDRQDTGIRAVRNI